MKDAFAIVRGIRRYLGTMTLFLIIAVVFGLEVATGSVANDDALVALGALPDSALVHGEYWRFVSFGFLHWDLTHVLLNTALLFTAGPISEQRVGASRLLLVFAVASVSSGIGIFVKHLLWHSHGASVGASGGMFGLLGLAFVLLLRFPPRNSMIRSAVTLVIICGFVYSVLPGVSMIGHVIGFALGALMAVALQSGVKQQAPDDSVRA